MISVYLRAKICAKYMNIDWLEQVQKRKCFSQEADMAFYTEWARGWQTWLGMQQNDLQEVFWMQMVKRQKTAKFCTCAQHLAASARQRGWDERHMTNREVQTKIAGVNVISAKRRDRNAKYLQNQVFVISLSVFFCLSCLSSIRVYFGSLWSDRPA